MNAKPTILAVMLCLAVCLPALSAVVKNEHVTIQLDVPAYSLDPDTQSVSMAGCGYLKQPGLPMLPVMSVNVLLPPGARALAVKVQGKGLKELPGHWSITPARLRACYGDIPAAVTEALDKEYQSNLSRYRDNAPFPGSSGWLTHQGGLRGYRYALVTCSPFQYFPVSGELAVYTSMEIDILCTFPGNGKHVADSLAQERAQSLFVNFDAMSKRYQVTSGRAKPGYLVLTTDNLKDLVEDSAFITWKERLGFRPMVVTIADPMITNQPGRDPAEQIRNFLRQYYLDWNVRHLLIVGHADSIPMRYCYPNPNDHTNAAGDPTRIGGEVPTDYYYADLSDPDDVSWDLDGDGYPGEYGQDAPDFLADIYVGRVPTDNQTRVGYALDKIKRFEADTGTWKENALNAGAFYYFTNEDNNGRDADDGATCPWYLEQNIMTGWGLAHYSEQEGLETSTYPWDALTHAAFTSDWRTGQYAVVNEGAHGYCDQVARKVWDWDDGDGVPESGEIVWKTFLNIGSTLDDDYPAIFSAMSCLVGYPEHNAFGNMGIDLVCKPGWGAASAVVASSRIVYGPLAWTPDNGGGCESVVYEFNRYLIQEDQPLGAAMYQGKYYTHTHFSFSNYVEHINMLEYNLFGDPAMVLEGLAPYDPVYRFFNTQTGVHFYTTSTYERDYVRDNLAHYTYEGVKFYVHLQPTASACPMYRFFNTRTGVHFYTISQVERDYIINTMPHMNYEGIKFYVFAEPASATCPVYRFFNTQTGGHLYTISQAERDYIINNMPHYTYEGPKFHVYDHAYE